MKTKLDEYEIHKGDMALQEMHRADEAIVELLLRISRLEKDGARLEEELQTALDNTDHWIAEVATRGLVVHAQAERIARLAEELAQKELVIARLRTSWREDCADLGRFDDALHSAFQDYRDDFPEGSIEDFDKWLACHVTWRKEMRAP